MHVHGQCHCGAVAFEADVDPEHVGLCHCTDCQTLSGSAFRIVVAARPGTFTLLRGAPTIYVKTAESGNRRRHTFCAGCGTPIASSADTDTPVTCSLRVGTLAEREALPPKIRAWCRSQPLWVASLGAIPGRDQ